MTTDQLRVKLIRAEHARRKLGKLMVLLGGDLLAEFKAFARRRRESEAAVVAAALKAYMSPAPAPDESSTGSSLGNAH
jgi:hypothetical protein